MHGQPPDVLVGRSAGVELGAVGFGQLAWLRDHIGRDIDAVYSSPQLRCRQTAAVFGLPVSVDAGLDEIDFGSWTGQSFAGLEDRADWWAWNAARG